MKKLLRALRSLPRLSFDWLDDRTGIKQVVHEALYERIPCGARFRYVTGSMLVFAFVTQMITGIILWMAYSPSSQTAWVAIPISVLGMDFISYIWHRANHAVPFLWRFHQAHHSDMDYTVTTALRFHPAELLLALPLRLVAVVVFGVPIAGIIVFEVIFAFANFYEHGNIDLPLKVERTLGSLLITPALHRRHHRRRDHHPRG